VTKAVPPREPVKSANNGHTNGGHGKSIYWPQDFLRRAHRAMLDSRSSDLLTLARVALEAAIRSEIDLLELLSDAPQQKREPARANGAASDHVAA
jgi:hypothetical protein